MNILQYFYNIISSCRSNKLNKNLHFNKIFQITKTTILLLVILFLLGCEKSANNATLDKEYQKLKIESEIRLAIDHAKDSSFSFFPEFIEAADIDRIIVKDTLKKDIFRDWGINAKIYKAKQWIDSINVLSPDTAIVFTIQSYQRTFTRPHNQLGEDEIVSMKKYKETWIKRSDGWKQSRVKVLGRLIYVNGQPYNPEGN